jgi:solute carrier family 35
VAGEYLVWARTPSPAAGTAIGAMVLGAVAAGATDLTFSGPGYAWVTVCVLSTAAYLILIRALKDKTGLNQHALLMYNNLIAAPLMALYFLFFSGEVRAVLAAPQLRDPAFCAFLLLSASQAFLLNLCIFWCTTVNSPLATTVTGQVKDIATTGLGLIMFGDVVLSGRNLAALSIGLMGGVGYAAVGYVEATRAAAGARKGGGGGVGK